MLITGTNRSLLYNLNQRETGLCRSFQQVTYILELDCHDLQFKQILDDDIHETTLIGISPKSTWLVVRARGADDNYVFYTFDGPSVKPMFSIRCVRDHLVRVHFGSNEFKLLVMLTLQKYELNQATQYLSYSGFGNIDILIPYLKVRLRLTTGILFVYRSGNNMRLVKRYITMHSKGFLLNTGVNVINIFFEDNKTQPINKGAVHLVVGGDSSKAQLEQEVGKVQIYPNDSKIFLSFKDENSLLRMYRRILNVEKTIFSIVNPYIERIASKNGSQLSLKGVVDYETDIVHVYDGRARFNILACCDVEFSRENDLPKYDIYMMEITFWWNLTTGEVHELKIENVKKIPPQNAYRNHWYPYPGFPRDRDFHYTYLSNGARITNPVVSSNGELAVLNCCD